MRSDTPQTIYRSEYEEPVFHVATVEMGIDLDPAATTIATRLTLVRNRDGVLVLNGDALELVALRVDGRTLAPDEYVRTDSTLSIAGLPERCVLDTEVRGQPKNNTSLLGLYVSNGNFFTQCEAEGFRRITYFPDRPDVMARYTVMLRADKKKYPVLLSNGNLVESGDLGDGRHYAKWHDPFPKPSYLFALVAGKLAHVERHIKTQSGRDVLLQIYVEQRDLAKVEHALASLERSVAWDEKRFGLELDLERFMIVAVSDFNAGAMENKGLNIFNTKYVLANPNIATDADFENIESVVGHEYFHNWTGNRVTCRDWFQLTLKEGLTVFRDQEFSSDISAGYLEGRDGDARAATARAVNRIANVRNLRAVQFPEDAGPMAHPIRPESYQEINNFYTPTVYEKGAEVIRMQQTLLGRDGFRLGLDEYFRRHDGQAVTCEDFVAAMESVYVQSHSGDLQQFRRWYSQAGTPRVSVRARYDAAEQRLALTFRQSCPKVGVEKQGGQDKQPFHIPVALGLVGADGRDLPLRRAGEKAQADPPTTVVLDFTQNEEEFVFLGVKAAPVPSLFRGFSAPVIVDYPYTTDELALLSAHDSDAFNRWEAGQRLASQEIARLAREPRLPAEANGRLVDVFRSILLDAELDPALKDLALTLPSESVIGEELPVYDPAAVHRARNLVRTTLARQLTDLWHDTYHGNATPGPYSPDPISAGRRALKNIALHYLTATDENAYHELAWRQYQEANNMTDRFEALVAMTNNGAPQRKQALDDFYTRYAREALVVDKWLRVQALAQRVSEPVLDVVARLMSHKAFSLRNPNKVYSLLSSFFFSNPSEFHRPDGTGYAFWAEQVVAVDAINPSIASRLARALDRWAKLTPPLQERARAALRRVHEQHRLSKDVSEILEKALSA